MSSTMVLLKPSALDVGLILRRYSSCWIMNGTKFVYVLLISGFLRHVLNVLLKSPDACTLL